MSNVVEPPPSKPKPSKAPRADRPKRRPLKPWNVVLLDDDDHTFAYVIGMLVSVCGHAVDHALKLAKDVDARGRVIVFTGHRELAELKCDQIRSFGGDIRVATCKGSMTAVVQPAC